MAKYTYKTKVLLCGLIICVLVTFGIDFGKRGRGDESIGLPLLFGYDSSSSESSSESAECGNNDVETGEDCDDGDTDNGDGCSSTCTVESGYTCTGDPSTCTQTFTCGNNDVETGEDCDDGDTDNGDGCDSSCAVETYWTCTGDPSVCSGICGDGVIKGDEACDDDDTTAGDGCSEICTLETGYTCTGEPSSCSTSCGDGSKADSEGCDDSNTTAGDGCDASCGVETGYSCTGSPSVCSGICGDSLIKGSEECDDGNSTNTDSCLSTCKDASCGDGFVWANNEECEPPGTATCSDSCTGRTGGGGSSAVGTISGRSERRNVQSVLSIRKDPEYKHAPDVPVRGRVLITCGNGKFDLGEECDDGNKNSGDGCSSYCYREIGSCGDGIVQRALGEECEPTAVYGKDGVLSYPKIPKCADNTDAVFCSKPRAIGGGCRLIEIPVCGDGKVEVETQIINECGDGRKDGDEECDLGGMCYGGKYHGAVWHERQSALLCRKHGGMSFAKDGDGCSKDCKLEYCGDGKVQYLEQCDNGANNKDPNSACTDTCKLCSGLYSATLDLKNLEEGEHIVKVKVDTTCGTSTVSEASFLFSKKLVLAQGDVKAHKIASELKNNMKKSYVGYKPPKVSMITDKGRYLKGFDKGVMMNIIVADADGNVIHNLPPSAFTVALDGKIMKDVMVITDVSEHCSKIINGKSMIRPSFECGKKKIPLQGSIIGGSAGSTALSFITAIAILLAGTLITTLNKINKKNPICIDE